MENRQVNFEDLRKFYCDKDWMLDIIDQFDVDVRMMKNMAPYAAIQYIRKKIGYDDFLKEYAEKHQISWKQLMDVMAELEERSKNFKSYDEWGNPYCKIYAGAGRTAGKGKEDQRRAGE